MAPEPAEYISKILEDVFNELLNKSRNKIIELIKYLTRHLSVDYDISLVIYNLFDRAVKNKNMELAEYIIDDLYDCYDLYNMINIVVQHNSVECLKMIIFDFYNFNHRNLHAVESYNCDMAPETLKYFLALGYWKHSVVAKKMSNIFI